MSHAEFINFCTAIAQSYAHRATELINKINRTKDNPATISELQHRANLMTDQMEVWSAAPRWWIHWTRESSQ